MATMEANLCDINNLDADVLLPPRKRLLAGLKKQNSDGRSDTPSTYTTSSRFDSHLNNCLSSYINKSPVEMVEALKSAAEAAVKVAKAARAAAAEKAVVAAEAMAAAKSALDLVVNFSEDTVSRERYLKKNKMKRHIPVQMLYNKKRRDNTDEELARNLHRAINSSPRITKNSSTSDLESHKHKRHIKNFSSPEKLKFDYGGITQDGNRPSTSNGTELNAECSTRKEYVVRVDESTLNVDKTVPLKMGNGEVVTRISKGRMVEESEDPFSVGRKRGRIKQKKLPLSICNFRDQASPKEERKCRSLSLTERNASKDTAGNPPLFSVGPSGSSLLPIERTSTWKCKVFKAPVCVKQNKVMQS